MSSTTFDLNGSLARIDAEICRRFPDLAGIPGKIAERKMILYLLTELPPAQGTCFLKTSYVSQSLIQINHEKTRFTKLAAADAPFAIPSVLRCNCSQDL